MEDEGEAEGCLNSFELKAAIAGGDSDSPSLAPLTASAALHSLLPRFGS